jgi:D-arabinose 1-dehydrogenase-like Zn-dependent alcohol dehydrogenase
VISRATTAELAAAATAVNRLLSRGFRSRRTETVPLSGTAEAYRRLTAGELRGRVVIDVRA